MKYVAIIVAGGKGSRMNQDLPKQFVEIHGKPILMRSLEAFASCPLEPELILVLNAGQHAYWKALCQQHQFSIQHQLIAGGAERFHSVKNGLAHCSGEAIIAIHDAVRPLVSSKLIEEVFIAAENEGNAIAAVQAVDSIRRKQHDQASEALNRNEIYLVQTPQAFQSAQLSQAYAQEYTTEFTDDASVVEKAGFPIHLVPGERTNIKITFAEDLKLASWLFHTEQPMP